MAFEDCIFEGLDIDELVVFKHQQFERLEMSFAVMNLKFEIESFQFGNVDFRFEKMHIITFDLKYLVTWLLLESMERAVMLI